MHRKIVILIGSLAILALFSCANRAAVVAPLGSSKAITSFVISDPPATAMINETAHTVIVIVPLGTPLASIAPSIEISGASLSPASGAAQDFSSPVIYTVTAADGTTQAYTARIGSLPAVSTATIAEDPVLSLKISGTSASGGGNVADQGSAQVTERGVCWNTAGDPGIDGPHAANGSGTGSFSAAEMQGLSPRTVYYVRAYASNALGTAYGQEVSFDSGRRIGEAYAGGYVFYNNGCGIGLIAAAADAGGGALYEWGTNGNDTSAVGSSIGTGRINTDIIVSFYGSGNYAAKASSLYSAGLYADWFLPSLDELQLMHANLASKGIGNFADASYWSSTDCGYASAMVMDFGRRRTAQVVKTVDYARVRSVRVF